MGEIAVQPGQPVECSEVLVAAAFENGDERSLLAVSKVQSDVHQLVGHGQQLTLNRRETKKNTKDKYSKQRKEITDLYWSNELTNKKESIDSGPVLMPVKN